MEADSLPENNEALEGAMSIALAADASSNSLTISRADIAPPEAYFRVTNISIATSVASEAALHAHFGSFCK